MSALVLAQSVDAYTLTSGRLVATIAGVVALAGAVIGGLAYVRAARRVGNGGRRGAIVALVAGLTGMLTGGLVVAVADGGPGSGSGIVGGFVALVVGLIATVLGWLARNRSRATV